MNSTPIKDVVKEPGDLAHIIKSTIHVAVLGEMIKWILDGYSANSVYPSLSYTRVM